MNLTSHWNLTKELFYQLVKSVLMQHHMFLCRYPTLASIHYLPPTFSTWRKHIYKRVEIFVLDSVGATRPDRITCAESQGSHPRLSAYVKPHLHHPSKLSGLCPNLCTNAQSEQNRCIFVGMRMDQRRCGTNVTEDVSIWCKSKRIAWLLWKSVAGGWFGKQ